MRWCKALLTNIASPRLNCQNTLWKLHRPLVWYFNDGVTSCHPSYNFFLSTLFAVCCDLSALEWGGEESKYFIVVAVNFVLQSDLKEHSCQSALSKLIQVSAYNTQQEIWSNVLPNVLGWRWAASSPNRVWPPSRGYTAAFGGYQQYPCMWAVTSPQLCCRFTGIYSAAFLILSLLILTFSKIK